MADDFETGPKNPNGEQDAKPRTYGLDQSPKTIESAPVVEAPKLSSTYTDSRPTNIGPPGSKPENVGLEDERQSFAKPVIEKAFNALITDPNDREDDETTASSLLKGSLVGSVSNLGEYYFPPDLIGGCCPRVMGNEQEIVWNAAAEASDSERIHVIWQAKGDKIWYLAVRSSELASYPNTWCPFGSLLPGMKDANEPPICYTHYSDEAATMMTLAADGMQIHRGTTSMMRAKAERTARALDNAPVIELVPDRIEKLTPVPWYSLSLFEDRARRVWAALSVLSALFITGLALFVWLFVTMAIMAANADKKEIEARAKEKSLQLLQAVQTLHASPMRDQLAKFGDLNDGLLGLNGLLEIYQIQKGKVLWRAIVPPNVTSDRINELGGQTLDTSQQGVVIGNSRDAMAIGRK